MGTSFSTLQLRLKRIKGRAPTAMAKSDEVLTLLKGGMGATEVSRKLGRPRKRLSHSRGRNREIIANTAKPATCFWRLALSETPAMATRPVEYELTERMLTPSHVGQS